MKDLVLRAATAADAAALVAVIHAAFEQYRAQLDPPSGAHDETEEGMIRWMARAHACVAIADGDVIGCVRYELGPELMTMSRLAVLPERRGLGVGRALVAYVEQRARELNCPLIQLGVRLVLRRLQTWYERLGYRQVALAAHPGFSQPTYAVLEKHLDEGDRPGARTP